MQGGGLGGQVAGGNLNEKIELELSGKDPQDLGQ